MHNGGNKTLAFLIAIIPIAYIYAFPFLINNFGNAILLLICLPIVLYNIYYDNHFIFDKAIKYYIFFSLYTVIISLIYISRYNNSDSNRSLIAFIVFTFVYILLIGYKKYLVYFLRYYKSLSVLFSIFLIIQFVAYHFLAIKLSGIFPFLKTYYEIEGEAFVIGFNEIVRISSFFIEPSHFALYVAPALCIFLWDIGDKSKYRSLYIIVIGLAMILSTSANGIILLSIILLTYIFSKYFYKFNIKYYIFGAIILSVFVSVFLKSSLIQSSTYSLFITREHRSESKADARIYRGFLFYYELPVNEKLFGIGWRNAKNYSLTHNNSKLYNRYYITAFDYFNSISAILIYSGLLGFIFFICFIMSLWRKMQHPGGKVLIIIILASMTSSSIIMTEVWPLYLSIIFSTLQIKQEKNSEKI